MKKTNKIFLLATACSLCLAAGATSLNSLSASAEVASVSDVNLYMQSGATIRYVAPADETEEAKEAAYKQNGIKFAVCLSESDYEGLEALENGTYTSVSYGVLIAPESYGTLNAGTVFGVNGDKLYDWAVWDEENGVWSYEGDGTYKRITNVVSDTMYLNEEAYTADGTKYTRYEWSGSLTNLKEANLTLKFQSVGYIAYTVDGTTHYVFAEQDDNVRSMTQVAQKAVEDPDNADKKDILQAAYVTPVTDVERTYTVEHYDEFGDKFATTTETTTIDDEVTLSGDYNDVASDNKANKIVNGTFDASNANNVLSISKVYADDTYTLKKYYSNVTYGVEMINANDSRGNIYPFNNSTETVKAVFKYNNAVNESDSWKISARWVKDNGTFIRRFDINWTGSALTFCLNDTAVYTAGAEYATTVKNALAGDGLTTYFVINGTTLSWYFPISASTYSVTSYTVSDTDGANTQIGLTTTNMAQAGTSITYDKLSEGTDVETELGLTVSPIYTGSASRTCTSSNVAVTNNVTVSYSTKSVLVAQMKMSVADTGAGITESAWKLDLRGQVYTGSANSYHSLALFNYDGTDLTVGQRSASGASTATSTKVSNVDYALTQLQDSDGWTVVVVRDGTNYQVWVDDNGTLTLMSEYVDNTTGEYKQLGIGYNASPTTFVDDVLTLNWTLYANTTDISVVG